MSTSAARHGHRGRLRRQLLESGLDSFSDVQVLELLLSFAIARKDVNPLAHALLAEFGAAGNTLPEAIRAGRYFAQGVAEFIQAAARTDA